MLANDLAAARAFLERKNDERECNIARMIVIGAGEGGNPRPSVVSRECARSDRGSVPAPARPHAGRGWSDVRRVGRPGRILWEDVRYRSRTG